jgi:gluconate 2-dehydrogenase alpha chain
MDAARSYWPIKYDDLESYHDKFEGVSGAWGKAGRLQVKKIVGSNIFQALRSSEFPNPPLTPSHNMVLFEKRRDLGNQSFSAPESNTSADLVNAISWLKQQAGQ